MVKIPPRSQRARSGAGKGIVLETRWLKFIEQ